MKGLKYQLKIRAGKSLLWREELFPPGHLLPSTFPAPGDRAWLATEAGSFLLKVLRLQGAVSLLCSGAARAKKGDRTWALARVLSPRRAS